MADSSGSQCRACDGTFRIASSQAAGEYQVRYLRCQKCGCTGKSVVGGCEVRRTKLFTAARANAGRV